MSNLRSELDPYEHGYGLRFPRSAIVSKVFMSIGNTSESIKILDLGCGLGTYGYLLDALENATYVGVDSSPAAISLATEKWIKSPNWQRMTLINADLQQFLQNTKLEFDVVIDSATLQHCLDVSDTLSITSEITQVFESINSVLAKEGFLVSLWASDVNPSQRMAANFPNFIGFETVFSNLADTLGLESLERITQSYIEKPLDDINLIVPTVIEFLVKCRKEGI